VAIAIVIAILLVSFIASLCPGIKYAPAGTVIVLPLGEFCDCSRVSGKEIHRDLILEIKRRWNWRVVKEGLERGTKLLV
jgi:hypothetical protein